MPELTWQDLATVIGLAAWLSIVVIPVAKYLFGLKGRSVLAVGFIAGQFFGQLAVGLLHGWSGLHAFQALVLGALAAVSATGLYEYKDKL